MLNALVNKEFQIKIRQIGLLVKRPYKCFYIKLIIFLMVILGPFNQTIAYQYERSFIGLRGAIGGVALTTIKQYAQENGYKNVTTPFCHLDLEGTLCIESRWLINYISSRIELGYAHIRSSFIGEENQNKIRQSVGLHFHGCSLSALCYVYPNGRFADSSNWNGHIGLSLLSGKQSKNMGSDIQAKRNDPLLIFCMGPVLGIGFEVMPGLQIECRYHWLADKFLNHKSKVGGDVVLHGVSLGIVYLFY